MPPRQRLCIGGNDHTHYGTHSRCGARLEFRLADGAANPYLMMAGFLAAGLNGMINKIDPGKRLDIDMYSEEGRVEPVTAAN